MSVYRRNYFYVILLYWLVANRPLSWCSACQLSMNRITFPMHTSSSRLLSLLLFLYTLLWYDQGSGQNIPCVFCSDQVNLNQPFAVLCIKCWRRHPRMDWYHHYIPSLPQRQHLLGLISTHVACTSIGPFDSEVPTLGCLDACDLAVSLEGDTQPSSSTSSVTRVDTLALFVTRTRGIRVLYWFIDPDRI